MQDQPEAVQHSVGEFVHVLIEAVVVVLGVSFSRWACTGARCSWTRARPVVALTIPLVLAVTFLFMAMFGIGLHKISLGALIVAWACWWTMPSSRSR